MQRQIAVFDEDYAFAEGFQSSVELILAYHLPGYIDLVRARKEDDLKGVDFWVGRDALDPLAVDVKILRDDKRLFFDDVPFDVQREFQMPHALKDSWATNLSHVTDLLLWFYVGEAALTRHYFAAPYKLCREVLRTNWRRWEADGTYDVYCERRTMGATGVPYSSKAIYVSEKDVAKWCRPDDPLCFSGEVCSSHDGRRWVTGKQGA